MNADSKDDSDEVIVNFTGARDNPTTARYERILQKRLTDAVRELKDKLTGLVETIYRASQGLQEKSDRLSTLYERFSRSQGRQQLALIILSVVVAISTAVYTWITWQSVVAMREANEIQRQLVTLQKQSSVPQPAGNPPVQGTPKRATSPPARRGLR